ncbi:GNAT family N-acetyltransferase [Candidatus Puniceispirillum sp.]|jgi:L-amino acid N-acyltransferase YncA|uniref:GNAT family N-acetyltransferase n=1 Tax=Candidatus Puniceispirillum sp. TaxID=2026719 RepID=UPI001ECEC83C|nr:N-acetyltransferase [Candidatus Puniceispirillum sp.]MBT6566251.1 N-acetyltransferase [Candidatus Puniceispirillum sp.]
MSDKSVISGSRNHIGNIRALSIDDMADVTAIYGHHVETSTASFETIAPSIEDMTSRFTQLQIKHYPTLVAVNADDHIMGFAYAGPHKPRVAYNHTVEDSIYVHPDHLSKGIGKALLASIIDHAQRLGYKQMMAVIGGSDNHGSINLHKALGFIHIGTAQKIGYKFNRMVDVVYMQRDLESD